MATTTPREYLAAVELFSTLDRSTLEALVSAGARMAYRPGGTVIEQGALGGGFQLILSGTATILVNGQQVRTLGEGDYVGEMSLFEDVPRSATVVAGDDGVKTLAISPLNFGAVLEAHPASARELLRMMARRIRDVEARAASK